MEYPGTDNYYLYPLGPCGFPIMRSATSILQGCPTAPCGLSTMEEGAYMAVEPILRMKGISKATTALRSWTASTYPSCPEKFTELWVKMAR